MTLSFCILITPILKILQILSHHLLPLSAYQFYLLSYYNLNLWTFHLNYFLPEQLSIPTYTLINLPSKLHIWFIFSLKYITFIHSFLVFINFHTSFLRISSLAAKTSFFEASFLSNAALISFNLHSH